MAEDNIQVRSGKPTPIPSSPSSYATVTNAGPGALYYKNQKDVSASSNDGELAAGESVTFKFGVHWFTSASTSRIFVKRTPEFTTDMATQAELDSVEASSVTAAELEANGKGYAPHGEEAAYARPEGFASVEWHGSVEPENAVEGDTWIEA